jgi:hypothetical protein
MHSPAALPQVGAWGVWGDDERVLGPKKGIQCMLPAHAASWACWLGPGQPPAPWQAGGL